MPRSNTLFFLLALLIAGGAWCAAATTPLDDSDPARNRALYGYAAISPAGNVVAGTWGTWTLTYTVGKLGIDDTGQILILTRTMSDWAPFQTDNPKGDNYVTVRTSGEAKLSARFDNRRAWRRPWWRGLIITVGDGFLKDGDKVIVTLGDRSGGGRGTRAQTFDLQDCEFRFMVDALATGQPVRVLESPRFAVVGGPAVRLEAIAPTELPAGRSGWLQLRAKDSWGNPAVSYRGTVRFTLPEGLTGLPAGYTFTAVDAGFHRFEEARVAKPGVYRVGVRDAALAQPQAESNAMAVAAFSGPRAFWGDFHGQSGESIGVGTVDGYFAYARGFAAIDFACHQANDFQVTREAWQAIQRATKKYHQPGRFVSYLGYEWSGNTGNGGDHNVIYLDDDQPIYHSSHAQLDDTSDLENDRHTVRELAGVLRGGRTVLIPHIGGRRANLDFYDPALMPAIEIYSDHGQFEWFLRDALSRGLKVGFVANSDDHLCKPGDSAPSADHFFVHGGLTCVYARELTRQALWEAIGNRRFYATTGERIGLRFRSGRHEMGEEISAGGPVEFAVEAAGTAGIERVELFRGLESVYRHSGQAAGPPPQPGGALNGIKVIWSGAENMQRNRSTVWNGGLTVSGGRIRGARGYRFDYPTEGILDWDGNRVTWQSRTAGDEDGVILDIEGLDGATLSFDTGPARFSVALRQVTGEDWVHAAGGLDRRVVLRRVAGHYLRDLGFTWTDRQVPSGTSAYWVRLLQEDGAVAWSSPIFVTRR
jgi:hypothetical protein